MRSGQGRYAGLTLVVWLLAVLAAPAAHAQTPTPSPAPPPNVSTPGDCTSVTNVVMGGACDATAPRPAVDVVPESPRVGSDVTLTATSGGRGLTYAWDTDED